MSITGGGHPLVRNGAVEPTVGPKEPSGIGSPEKTLILTPEDLEKIEQCFRDTFLGRAS
jgi:uncharacterized protein (DUF1330 family)